MTTALLSFACRQWAKEPETRVEDAYKWLIQATLGGDHAVNDDSGPRRWMDREWDSLGEPLPGEPRFVMLRPDGMLIRVNLRPFKADGGDKEGILDAFVNSANRFRADPSEFIAVWSELGKLLERWPIGEITAESWAELDAQARAAGYPAIEHSDAYLASRLPAYRVVLAELWGR